MHRFADFDFVEVVLCRIDVAVAVLKGRQARVYADVGGGLVDAKAQAGDFNSGIGKREAISEGGRGCRHGGGLIRG